MKKLIKNKFIFLAIIVICVSIAYLGIQKLIDNYDFKNNKDIVSSSGSEKVESEEGAKWEFGEGFGGISDAMSEENEEAIVGGNSNDGQEEFNDEGLTQSSEQFSDEETNLVLEEVEEAEEIEAENGIAVDVEVETKESATIEENKILVHITGEVNNPGVVALNEGARIVDAINAGGGTTPKADISKVNLVFVLDDGMKVNIPNSDDLKNNSDFEYITMSSGDGGRDDYTSSYGSNSSGTSSSSANSPSYGTGTSKKYDVVNINTATQTELETLPGIGPSLALKIINYRKENGKFSSIDQIKNVSGIGDSKFAELKGYISI